MNSTPGFQFHRNISRWIGVQQGGGPVPSIMPLLVQLLSQQGVAALERKDQLPSSLSQCSQPPFLHNVARALTLKFNTSTIVSNVLFGMLLCPPIPNSFVCKGKSPQSNFWRVIKKISNKLEVQSLLLKKGSTDTNYLTVSWIQADHGFSLRFPLSS